MTKLNEDQIDGATGGVIAGPNGEGCTEPRLPEKGFGESDLAYMVRTLGGHVHATDAPFDPEAGAYAGGHHHHHDDGDGDAHAGHHHHG